MVRSQTARTCRAPDVADLTYFYLTKAEADTLRAALHVYRERGYGDPFKRPDDVHELACPTVDDTSLDDVGIDWLSSKLRHPLLGQEVLPKSVWKAIDNLIDNAWDDELSAFEAADKEERVNHPFRDLVAVNNWLRGYNHTPESFL